MADAHETLQPYVADQLALVNHIHEAIERQLNDETAKKYGDAYPLIQRIDALLESHIKTLENHHKHLDGSSGSVVKNAVAAVAGVAAGLYDKVRTEKVTSMVRDDYTALSLASMGLTLLHTTALAVHHPETADIALNQLTDITPIIVEISEALPLIAVQEMKEAGEINDVSAGPEAVRNTQKAWGREVTG